MEAARLRRRIRYLLLFFIAGLLVSGLTAFPLAWEIGILNRLAGPDTRLASLSPAMAQWIGTLYRGLTETEAAYPFMFYGADWLPFAHIRNAKIILSGEELKCQNHSRSPSSARAAPSSR